MSQRKAGSARITRCRPHQSRTFRNRPGFNRSHSYDCHRNNSSVGAAFMLHHQTSTPDHLEANLKSSFRGSTFHPLIQSCQLTRRADEGSKTCPTPPPTLTTSAGSIRTREHRAGTPPRPVSFWGNNGLLGFPAQSPPPAYKSLLRAYGETCTWVEEAPRCQNKHDKLVLTLKWK